MKLSAIVFFVLFITSFSFAQTSQVNTLQATKVYADVELSWAASNASQLNHFVVERSFNGVGFEKIGTEEVLPQMDHQLFSFYELDAATTTKDTFYRLRVVDQEGNFVLTESVLLEVEKSEDEIVASLGYAQIKMNDQLEFGDLD